MIAFRVDIDIDWYWYLFICSWHNTFNEAKQWQYRKI